MPLPLLPTSLVGSYAQPEWLIDRKKLAGRFPPRVRAKELWRVAPEYLDAGAGRRDAARDPRPGARRPRHHHRRRDAARELLQPLRHRARRRRHRQSRHRARPLRPSQSGAARRRQGAAQASGRGARREVPARQHRRARSRSRCPARSRCRSRRRTISTRTRRRWRSTTPPPSTPRSRTCSRPAPTSCRSTSPTCRRGRRRRGKYGLKALNAALDGVKGTTAVHICFGYAAIIHVRPEGYSFLPEFADSPVQQVSIETAQSNLDCAVLEKLPGKTIILGVLDLSDMTIETPETVAARIRRALPLCAGRAHRRRAGLRPEIPAARGRVRQDVRDGRGREDRAEGAWPLTPPSTSRSGRRRRLEGWQHGSRSRRSSP